MNSVAVACVAALGLLVFGLGFVISGARKQTNRFIGFDADPGDTLHKLVRAHGNTAEYAPMLAVLMLYLGAHQAAPWVVNVMIAVTACRYLMVAGMVLPASMARPNALRFIGAMGTYVCGFALCVATWQT
jgi:uncharacterized membrane protein YecN with MAPEG domain